MTRIDPPSRGADEAVERETILPSTTDSFYRFIRQTLTVIMTTAARIGTVVR